MNYAASHDLSAAAHNSARIPGFGRTGVRGLALSPRSRSEVPCHYLCTDCGLLVDQAGPSGYRALDELPAPKACPCCGGTDWADLREEAVVEQLKVNDDALPNSPQRLRRAVEVTLLGATILVLGTIALASAGLWFVVFGASFAGALLTKNAAGLAFFGSFISIFGLYALGGFLIPAFRRRIARRRRHPMRWLTDPSPAVAKAPLSGRPCRGYEVAIRKNDDPHAHPGTWLLVERRGEIDADAERTAISIDVESPAVKSYLRRRGLDPVGLTLTVYETVR